MYRAPQVLEVLCDPSFRPELAAYAGQTRRPATRLEKHLDTFETLNGCLMHVLQAFDLVIVMEIVGSARTEEEANSAELCPFVCLCVSLCVVIVIVCVSVTGPCLPHPTPILTYTKLSVEDIRKKVYKVHGGKFRAAKWEK